jgi:hypothetical protein
MATSLPRFDFWNWRAWNYLSRENPAEALRTSTEYAFVLWRAVLGKKSGNAGGRTLSK